MIYKLSAWLRLRKNTTPVHWLLGAFLATISTFCYFPAGFALLVLAAVNQAWNDREEARKNPSYVYQGCTDWWESWAVYLGYLMIITVPLNLAGVIQTIWI